MTMNNSIQSTSVQWRSTFSTMFCDFSPSEGTTWFEPAQHNGILGVQGNGRRDWHQRLDCFLNEQLLPATDLSSCPPKTPAAADCSYSRASHTRVPRKALAMENDGWAEMMPRGSSFRLMVSSHCSSCCFFFCDVCGWYRSVTVQYNLVETLVQNQFKRA